MPELTRKEMQELLDSHSKPGDTFDPGVNLNEVLGKSQEEADKASLTGLINKLPTLKEILEDDDITKEDLAEIVLYYRDEYIPQIAKEVAELEKALIESLDICHAQQSELGGLTVEIEILNSRIERLKLKMFDLEHPEIK